MDPVGRHKSSKLNHKFDGDSDPDTDTEIMQS
jgi:hypothetical protein